VESSVQIYSLVKVRSRFFRLSVYSFTQLINENTLGELKHIQKLKFWPLHSVLMDKYLISELEALRLESFLQPMLNLNPDKRATAEAMLSHDWFNGVVVQGEIEVYERSEAMANDDGKEERVQIEIGKATAKSIGGMDIDSIGIRNASIIDPQLVNALKPVDHQLAAEVNGASQGGNHSKKEPVSSAEQSSSVASAAVVEVQ
jgi:serine/threonine protein kinase